MKRSKFAEEFKQEAVKIVVDRGYSVSDVAKRLGVSAQSLYKCVKDLELKFILSHNRDEEKEYAAMILEWIRRKDQDFEKELIDCLFNEKSIVHK